MDHKTESVASTVDSFAGLDEIEKRVLSYASSMGKEFDFSVLAIAMEMEEEPLAELLERLVQRGILKELKGGDSYAFTREEFLSQAYREISSSRSRVVHKKIAEAYEKLHPDPTPDIIPEIGRQFYLGRVHDKSLMYNRYAAAQAVAAFSPDVAIRYLERAREDLSALPGDHRLEEADLLKELGQQYEAMGDGNRAEEFYGESLKKLPEEEVMLRALILLSRADAAREMDKLELVHQYCEEAIRLFEKAGHKKGLALAHRVLSRTAYRIGQLDVGRKEIEATLALLAPGEDPKLMAGCYIDKGNIHSGVADPEEQAKSIESYRKAIQILEPLRDYRELARAHMNLAIAMMPTRASEAVEEIEKARSCSEKTKDRRGLAWRLFNGVEMFLAVGRVEEAMRDNEEAGKILSQLNDPVGVQQVALNRGILAQYRKSYEESEKAYLGALKMAEQLGYPPVLVEVLIHLAMMYADWGKDADARKLISRVREMGEDKVYSAMKAAYENLKKRVGL
jgi:tetratricopeptide (TPR) repeat protein